MENEKYKNPTMYPYQDSFNEYFVRPKTGKIIIIVRYKL